MDCLKCGTCCTAPDISTLAKPVGVSCAHLEPSGLCGIYADRPAVCRGYRSDELCREIAAPTLEERVAKYRRIFDI